MILLHVTYTFEDAFDRANYFRDLYLAGIPQASREEPGNLLYEFYLSADMDHILLLVEKWESEEALAAHRETPHFAQIPEIRAQYNMSSQIERFDI